MRKRVRIVLAALLVALVSVIVWQGLREREPNPVVNGKPLASWLDYFVFRQSEAQEKMANQALEKAGTNAIPTLLWMMRQRDSALKGKVMELLQRQHFIKVHFIPAKRRNQAAYFAFLKLGTRAEAAVPAFHVLRLDRSYGCRRGHRWTWERRRRGRSVAICPSYRVRGWR